MEWGVADRIDRDGHWLDEVVVRTVRHAGPQTWPTAGMYARPRRSTTGEPEPWDADGPGISTHELATTPSTSPRRRKSAHWPGRPHSLRLRRRGCGRGKGAGARVGA